jgi:hypothetical protein
MASSITESVAVLIRSAENSTLKWLYKLSGINLCGQLAVVEGDKLWIRGAVEE